MSSQQCSSLWQLVVALSKDEKRWKEAQERLLDMPERPASPLERVEVGNDIPEGVEWLDATFIAESTGHDEKDIEDLVVRNAVSEGSNYCSTLLRVRAKVSSADGEPIQLIVKILPKGELMVGFVTQLGFFRKEIEMLTKTLPALQELGMARCGRDSPLARPLGPRALPCSREDTLVMEDLSVEGYRNAERRDQLDMPHCKFALSLLARLHALSVALHREDPEAVEGYGECLYLDSNSETNQHLEIMFNNFANEIAEWSEFQGTDYPERVRAMASSAYTKIRELVKPKENSPFNVLNHGDYWINNMMFRYDKEDDEPVDSRVVDLQMPRYSSLALDLQYFINTSVREEIYLTSLDDLLEFYRLEFNENLAQLGLADAEIGADELKAEFDSKSFFGFNASMGIMCAVVAEPSERLRLDELKADDLGVRDPMTVAWRGKRYRQLLPKRVEYFVNLGVI